jgi:ribosomal protein S18 acetylase RimI-like enzyme
MTDVDYQVREFGTSSSESVPAKDLAELHAKLLAHSPLVLMGPEFVERFYYTVLPNDGAICGAIAYVDGLPAGFIVATGDPEGFMSQAVRAHWLQLAWIMAGSVLKNPRRILAIKEARDIQKNVKVNEFGPGMGELLSFGVLPAYRSRAFIRQTSIQVGVDLLKRAVAQLQDRRKTHIRAIVDKDNLEAQLFYRFNGWKIGSADVKGWRVPTMEFLLEFSPTNAADED